jgi:E3 ubiquitin-protein ligase MARCH6
MADVAADRPPAAEQEEARPPSSTAAVAEEDEEEEEGDVCRICRNPGDDEHPLRYPCACSGSIKFVHQDCLLQWLDHSNSRQCEVCKHAFSFSPVYADNAPSRLPFQELIVGVGMKACHVLQFVLRLAFVLSVWLMIIPFITYWIWRLTFVRSLGEAQRLFLSHISAQLILSDCLHGFLLSAIIVLIFLGATSLRDYIRHLRELGGHDAERDDGGRERHGARAVRRLPGPNNRVPAADGNVDELAEAQGLGAGELLRRNAENVAARLERLEAQVEQMLDGLDDADGAEDVPFDELVGMQGPVFHLVENAITVRILLSCPTTCSCFFNEQYDIAMLQNFLLLMGQFGSDKYYFLRPTKCVALRLCSQINVMSKRPNCPHLFDSVLDPLSPLLTANMCGTPSPSSKLHLTTCFGGSSCCRHESRHP